MNNEKLAKLMQYNVSLLFTFGLIDRHYFFELEPYIKNTYSYCKDKIDEKGNILENNIYYVIRLTDKSDELVDNLFGNHIALVEKLYVGDYIILTMDKSYYMNNDDFDKLSNSNYYDFSQKIKKEVLYNNCINIQNFIINKNSKLIVALSNYVGEDISEKDIYWKAFIKEEEMLDLQKLSNMKSLGIKEQWILDEIDRASIFEKAVYEKVLRNTFEIETPKVNSLIAKFVKINDYNYEELHERLENKLKELVGKSQYRMSIKGSTTKYSMLPNSKDLKEDLQKVCKKYNLLDMEKVEKCLLRHIAKLDFPVLQYYILKNSKSQLATDYFEFNDEDDREIIKNINPNSVF